MRVQSQRKGYFSKQLRWSHPFMLKKHWSKLVSYDIKKYLNITIEITEHITIYYC